MTQDEIIDMANQAELCQCIWIDDEGQEIASLVAFAKLVEDAAFVRWAAQTKLAVQEEREVCAEICQSMHKEWVKDELGDIGIAEPSDCARAIRARGEA